MRVYSMAKSHHCIYLLLPLSCLLQIDVYSFYQYSCGHITTSKQSRANVGTSAKNKGLPLARVAQNNKQAGPGGEGCAQHINSRF